MADLYKAFPQATAADLIRAIYARKALLQNLFFSIRNAVDEASALREHKDKLFPQNDPGSVLGRSEAERRLSEEIATHSALYADAANALIMLIDAPLKRFGRASGIDQRTMGDDAYNGVKFSEAIHALANRHRHLDEWSEMNATKNEVLKRNPSVKVLVALDVDPLAFDTAYHVVNKCGFKSYHDFEQRLLSIPRALLASIGVGDVEVSADGWKFSIRGIQAL